MNVRLLRLGLTPNDCLGEFCSLLVMVLCINILYLLSKFSDLLILKVFYLLINYSFNLDDGSSDPTETDDANPLPHTGTVVSAENSCLSPSTNGVEKSGDDNITNCKSSTTAIASKENNKINKKTPKNKISTKLSVFKKNGGNNSNSKDKQKKDETTKPDKEVTEENIEKVKSSDEKECKEDSSPKNKISPEKGTEKSTSLKKKEIHPLFGINHCFNFYTKYNFSSDIKI